VLPVIRVLPALLVLAVAMCTITTAGSAAAAPQAAVVALGDSAASGEGAGDYAPGTRGEAGDWCHRSPHAYIYATRLAPVAIDLACSGADTADVAVGGSQYGETAQVTQLANVARRYRVTTVTLQIGANDDAALVATGITCIKSFLDVLTPPCRQTVGPLVPQRMAATAAKVEKSVGAVRAAMRGAGYADGAWRLVLVSYAAPITDRMIPLNAAQGCPYSRADAAWGRRRPRLLGRARDVPGGPGAQLRPHSNSPRLFARGPHWRWPRRVVVLGSTPSANWQQWTGFVGWDRERNPRAGYTPRPGRGQQRLEKGGRPDRRGGRAQPRCRRRGEARPRCGRRP